MDSDKNKEIKKNIDEGKNEDKMYENKGNHNTTEKDSSNTENLTNESKQNETNKEGNKNENNKSSSSEDKNKIMFFSLSPVEQERLISRLKEQILQSESIFAGRCCLFCSWVWNSYIPSATKPAPTVLTQNLDFIREHFKEKEEEEPDRLFFEGGSQEKIDEYYTSIKENKTMDLFEADLYSLAIACRMYMEKEIDFLEEDVYRKVVEQFNEEQEDYVIERLPFLFNQRSLVKDVIKISKEENDDECYQDWGNVLFKDTNNKVVNGKILKKLTTTEFDAVDEKFF